MLRPRSLVNRPRHVSYTHLDVYKRQMLLYLYLLYCHGGITLLIPVFICIDNFVRHILCPCILTSDIGNGLCVMSLVVFVLML